MRGRTSAPLMKQNLSHRPVRTAASAALLLVASICLAADPPTAKQPTAPVAADATAASGPGTAAQVPPGGGEFEAMSLAEVGVDPPAFTRAIAPLYDGSMIEMHSILVLAHGALVYEDYFKGNTDRIDFDHGAARVPGERRQWKQDDLHYVASVSKSVSAFVAGIALGELGWSLDDPLAPRLQSEPWLLAGEKSGITARHILTMTSGIKWNEWSGTSHEDTWSAPERFRYFAALPMDAPPGERWTYNSAAPNVLLLALDQAVEGGIRKFADRRFFSPLGIDNYRWGAFEGDIPDGGAGLYLRPRDMAKIGLLIRSHGLWHGTQIVPRDYMLEATSPQVSAAPAVAHQYGYLVWVRQLAIESGDPVQYIAVEGDGGNQINVFPDRDLIVVTTGGSYRQFLVYDPQAQRLLARIVPLFRPPATAQ